MNALVKKEIRLLLPSALAILALETVLPWLGGTKEEDFSLTPVFFFFGMILMAVDSFGREFSLGTFSSLMSQPLERVHFWRTKIAVLFSASAIVYAAYFISCKLLLQQVLISSQAAQQISPRIAAPDAQAAMLARGVAMADFHNAILASLAVMLVAVTGGLWTTLLLRQVAAAFWMTFLAPAAIMVMLMLCLPATLANDGYLLPLYCLAGVYAITGLWFAHRLFYRAQDVGWTGGVIVFSKWRYFEGGKQSDVSTRKRRPIAALMKKEFQLQSISWFCATVFMALHILIIAMRKVHGSFARDSISGTISEFFWAVWLIMPLVIGCAAVADERRLGMMEGQACLPASRRLQFALKYLLAIFSGALLGAVAPIILEDVAISIGAPNPGVVNGGINGNTITIILALTAGLAFAGTYASTLAKSFLQAMGVAVMVIIGATIFTSFARQVNYPFHTTLNPSLTLGLSVVAIPFLAPWLSYRNFGFFQEPGRTWRRNILAVSGTGLLIFLLSALLNNRAWEAFQPVEPAHGPAQFSLANPPVMQHQELDENLLLRLPSGPVLFYRSEIHHSQNLASHPIDYIFNPWQMSIRLQNSVAGSNWTSAVIRNIDILTRPSAGEPLESIGIQADGSLWSSERSVSPDLREEKMIRFGKETGWKMLSWPENSRHVVLLKKDGTLWQWGTNSFYMRRGGHELIAWPTLQNLEPRQIGTNSDWTDISSDNPYVQKSNGSTWLVSDNTQIGKDGIIPATNFDHVDVEKITQRFNYFQGAKVRTDGTLWFWIASNSRMPVPLNFQYGNETNWVAAAYSSWGMAVALKSDGTIWRCFNPGISFSRDPAKPTMPIRLSIHDDWVAITSVIGGTVALAADGSLWLWPDDPNYYRYNLLKISKHPLFLGNVLSKAE